MNRRLQIVCGPIDAKLLFWADNGNRYGFEPDVARLVFAEAGRDFESIWTKWVQALQYPF